MELYDAKSFLNQVNYSELQISTRRKELETLEALLLSPEAPPGTDLQILSLQEELTREIDGLVGRRCEILQLIARLPKPEHRIVLELHYLRGWSFSRIAVNMKYGKRYIYRLHAAALKNFSEILKDV